MNQNKHTSSNEQKKSSILMPVNRNQAYTCLCPRIKHTHAYESKPRILMLVSQKRHLPTTQIGHWNALLFIATGKALNQLQCVKNNLQGWFSMSAFSKFTTGRRSVDPLRSFTGYRFRPESRTKWHCYVLKATNSDRQPTCHRCCNSIRRHPV